MNRTLIVAALSLTFPLAGITQSPTETASVNTPMAASEVHSLMKSAHSSAEYKQIAGYFDQQEAVYRARAAQEKIRFDELAQINLTRYQKYPRPVDVARSSYESDVASADKAALKARHYDQLASGQTTHDRELAASSQGKQ